jgi:tRNA threonylcarbamoyladenosine modification (KEOPS) complex Cgi121 subunit
MYGTARFLEDLLLLGVKEGHNIIFFVFVRASSVRKMLQFSQIKRTL